MKNKIKKVNYESFFRVPLVGRFGDPTVKR